jgi:2-polyprenyl-6-methoxyphenol hydroxylase-like FAD-dependent oxidoreductase
LHEGTKLVACILIVGLIGDSARAMLATFGQGANMAFEDAYVPAQWLRASAEHPHAALAGYEAVRKPRATRVQQLSRTEVHFKLHSIGTACAANSSS